MIVESQPDAVRETSQDTLELLEFHLIRQQLARYTTLAPARESVLSLAPSSNLEQIRHRQQGTLEARNFIEEQGSLDLTGVEDIRGLGAAGRSYRRPPGRASERDSRHP